MSHQIPKLQHQFNQQKFEIQSFVRIFSISLRSKQKIKKNVGFLCDCNEVKIAELISRSYTQQFFQALGVVASLI